jgi:predicted Ser/Thr protein kinase
MPTLSGFLKPLPSLKTGLLVPVYNWENKRCLQDFDRRTFKVRRLVDYSEDEVYYSVSDAQRIFGFSDSMINGIRDRFVGDQASFAFSVDNVGVCGSSIDVIKVLDKQTGGNGLSDAEVSTIRSFLAFLQSRDPSNDQISEFVKKAKAPNKAPIVEHRHAAAIN